MSKKAKLLSLFALSMLLVFACSLPASQSEANDPNIIFTAAAGTASVQLTEAARDSLKTQTPTSSPPALAPSFTPLPPTATPTENNCDKAKFVTDVTISDGTVLAPGEAFTKTWRLKNIGTCTWTSGYALIYDGGTKMGGLSPQPLVGSVAPGETVDISIDLTAPATNGSYTGNWQIRNASNVLFAKVYVQIEVGSGGFAVTSVSLSVSGSCGHFVITAKITTNRAGDVTYKWKRSDGATDNASHPTLVFASAGTQSVSTDWYLGAAGSYWMDIYIDDPNHQQFGRATFSCP